MAIAYGGSLIQSQQVAQNPSFTGPTVTGSNTYGVVVCFRGADDFTFTSATWGGTSMSQAQLFGNGSIRFAIYIIANPSSGGTVQVNTSASKTYNLLATYYTGVNQSGQPDASNSADTATATSGTVSVTTIADNCWAILADCNQGGNTGETAGTGTTDRGPLNTLGTQFFFGDSNGVIHPAGSYSMTVTGANNKRGMLIISLSPATAIISNPSSSFTLMGCGLG